MEAHPTDNPADAEVRRRMRFVPRLRRPRVSKRWWIGSAAVLAAIGIGSGAGYLSAQLSGRSGELTDNVAELSQ